MSDIITSKTQQLMDYYGITNGDFLHETIHVIVYNLGKDLAHQKRLTRVLAGTISVLEEERCPTKRFPWTAYIELAEAYIAKKEKQEKEERHES